MTGGGVRERRHNLRVPLRRVRRGAARLVPEHGRPGAAPPPLPGTFRRAARGSAPRRGVGNLAELPPPAMVPLDRPLTDVLEELGEDSV
jgi:hypothetical protein